MPSAEDLAPLQRLVELAQQDVAKALQLFEAQTIPLVTLTEAEIRLTEAQIRLTEAQHDWLRHDELFAKLTEQHRKVHDTVQKQHAAGVVPDSEVRRSETALLEVQQRWNASRAAQSNAAARSINDGVVSSAGDQMARPVQPTTTSPTAHESSSLTTGREQRPTVPSIASAPFDVEQAKQHQEVWAKHLGVPVELTNSTGIKLRLIPPGKFQMGSTPEELAQLKQELDQNGASDFDKFVAQSSGPLHVVEVSTAFYISQYELTVAQFRRFVEATNYQPSAEQKNASHFTWKNFASVSDTEEKQPVCGVSWDDANAFCVWLSQQTQQTYHLPTEAQWEYACRAGSQTLWGSCNNASALSEYAIVEQSGTPHPASIGLRRANAFGLFDMHGNVDEWCLDWHNKDFYGRSPLVDPAYLETPKDGGSGRVSRGGSWNARAWWSRCATRSYDFPTVPTFPKGFRVVLKVDTPKNTTTE